MEWEPWEWTQADWAGLQFLVLIVAAAVAYYQVREARRLRLERSRPFVVLDVDVLHGIAELRVRNIGTTLARNVRFRFDPPLRSTRDHGSGKTIAELNLFAKGIPSLPPGMEVRALFDQLPARNETDLPDDYDVVISYADPLGNDYEEPMTVGVSHRRDMVHLARHDIHDVHKQLKELVKEVKKWSTTSSGGGILTMTRRDLRRRGAEVEWGYRSQEGPLLARVFFRTRLFVSRHLRL